MRPDPVDGSKDLLLRVVAVPNPVVNWEIGFSESRSKVQELFAVKIYPRVTVFLRRAFLRRAVEWTRYGGQVFTILKPEGIDLCPEPVHPTPQEFREQIIELARNGRSPKEPAEEFEPTETTIRNWLNQADRDDGLRSDGPTTEEKEEIRQLRKKLRKLQQNATSWQKPRPGSLRRPR